MGKCLDLSKAYKQLPVKPEHRDLAVVHFKSPDNENLFYVPNSLTFGSTAAVFAFNRVSRSLWFLLNTYLKIPSACHFDDFPLFSPTSSAERTDTQVSEFLNLLGWRRSQTGAKGLPFAESFDVLGFTLNLDQLKEGGGLILENKPGRVDKMKQKIFQVKENGIMKLHEAQELHGLLNFACGYFAGRQLRYACQRIFGFVEQGRSGGEPLRVWCDELLTLLEQSKPRCIPRVPKIHSILIFTDGSYESHVGGLGACIFDLASDERFVFESEVPKNLLDRWAKAVGDQLICQIELFVMVLVRWEFRHRLAFRRALLFVDNEAARGAVIKGPSDGLSL